VFEFNPFKSPCFPWELNIEPDASNEVADVYVESVYTKTLITNKDTRKEIPALKEWLVCLVRWKDTGKYEWIIRDKVGVLYNTKNLEQLLVMLDVYNISQRK
jgi:hypothetical protein